MHGEESLSTTDSVRLSCLGPYNHNWLLVILSARQSALSVLRKIGGKLDLINVSALVIVCPTICYAIQRFTNLFSFVKLVATGVNDINKKINHRNDISRTMFIFISP